MLARLVWSSGCSLALRTGPHAPYSLPRCLRCSIRQRTSHPQPRSGARLEDKATGTEAMPAEDSAARNFEQLDYRRALLDPERRCLLERRQSVAPAEGVELHMALL